MLIWSSVQASVFVLPGFPFKRACLFLSYLLSGEREKLILEVHCYQDQKRAVRSD